MSMQDNIADALNQIKMAQKTNKKFLNIYYTKLKFQIIFILFKFGYIYNFYYIILNKLKYIKIFPKYLNKKGVITNLEKISKPSVRIYKKFYEFKKINYGLGVLIISTSKGIMSHFEAFKKKLGGEIICYVY